MSLTTRKKPTIHHRRAHGQHHVRDRHYLKAYHPYLPLLLLAIVALAINAFWNSQAKVLGSHTAISAVQLLQDTNDNRAADNESSLTLDDRLNAAAQAKANDMVGRNYWSHNTPDGQTPWIFVKDSGYDYKVAGENLAYGFMDADSVVTGWMDSAEHRANILNTSYQEVGFGVAISQNYQGKGPETVVVAFYAEPETSQAAAAGDSSAGTFAPSQPYRTVSRVEMFAGGRAPWAFAALISLTLLGIIFFMVRHIRAWHRLLIRGEAFVLHHKTLDLVVLSLVLIGIVMTRASGFIG